MANRRDFLTKAGLAGAALAATALGVEEPQKGGKACKVLLINGSPHEEGCTYTALKLVADELEKAGVQTEMLYLGAGPVQDCTACGYCFRSKSFKCVHKEDLCNDIIDKAKEAHGFVFGSPVYYGHPSGRLLSMMDRLFYAGGGAFAGKPACAVTSSRRAGSLATLDAIQKHFTINQMPIISSCYWNEVHGNTADEVAIDQEGVSIMRQLGVNMARAVKAFAALPPMEQVPKARTNFVR